MHDVSAVIWRPGARNKPESPRGRGLVVLGRYSTRRSSFLLNHSCCHVALLRVPPLETYMIQCSHIFITYMN